VGCLHRPRAHRRWFLPVTGDLRVGGRFQLEGNAGAAAIIIVVFAGFATGQLVAF
jgi:hypothetical protein